MNFVALVEGVPTRMHFTDQYFVRRRIRDPDSGGFKWVESMVFQVDRLNGLPSFRTFSVLSSKLANQLTPFTTDFKFLEYDFIITEQGEGFTKEFEVQPVRIVPAVEG